VVALSSSLFLKGALSVVALGSSLFLRDATRNDNLDKPRPFLRQPKTSSELWNLRERKPLPTSDRFGVLLFFLLEGVVSLYLRRDSRALAALEK
jgi:hypothetical protein